MNPLFLTTSPTPRTPDIHLIVAPAGHAQAIAQALADDHQRPLLAWRRAAQSVQILLDAELGSALLARLQKGHTVTVWHGQDAWHPHTLRVLLAKDYENFSGRILWSRLTAPDGHAHAHLWTALADRLNTPDDADVRNWMDSNAELWPCWQLSPELNQQGQSAFAQWAAQHLAAVLASGPADEDASENNADEAAEVAQAQDADTQAPASIAWPWQDQPAWAAESWAQEVQTSQFSGAPANDSVVRLAAAKHSARSAQANQRLRFTAVLHPVSADDAWEAETSEPDRAARKQALPEAAAANIARAQLSCTAGDPTAPYSVLVALPGSAGPSALGRRWCLWLHPKGRLPLALVFQARSTAPWTVVEWPTDQALGARYQPSALLWQDLCGGGFSLEML